MTPTLRFADFHKQPRGSGELPPPSFEVLLFSNERIVSVETVEDALGHGAARVWIERGDEETADGCTARAQTTHNHTIND